MLKTRFNVFLGPIIESFVLFPLLLNCLRRWDAFAGAQFNLGLIKKNLKTRTNTATHDVSSCQSECGGWTLVAHLFSAGAVRRSFPPNIPMLAWSALRRISCCSSVNTDQPRAHRHCSQHCDESTVSGLAPSKEKNLHQPPPPPNPPPVLEKNKRGSNRFTPCPPHPSYYGNA